MEKIPSLFVRDWDGDPSRVTEVVDPRCQWVIDGEGVPTQKLDGSACMVKDGVFYKRYMVKHGRTAPEGFIPTGEPDPKTNKQTGWVLVGAGPEDQYHREAMDHHCNAFGNASNLGGTYELIGPKVQGNPENQQFHVLAHHGGILLCLPFRSFDSFQRVFSGFYANIEGIVFHHPDGRMAKIKLSDFGLKRKADVAERAE